MKKSKVMSIKKIDNDTVYAVETTTGTYIADGVYHHNCAFRCNNMRSGETVKYRAALKEKYGDEVPGELEKMAEENQYYKFTREELEGIIEDSKEQVKWYTKQL